MPPSFEVKTCREFGLTASERGLTAAPVANGEPEAAVSAPLAPMSKAETVLPSELGV